MAPSTMAEEQKQNPNHGRTGGDDCHAGHKGPSENDGKQCICQRCPVHPPPEPKPQVKVEMFACGHPKGGRNLIVCIDGTANQFGRKNTNVVELYNLVKKEKDDNQFTWYNSGIGTYARPHWRSLHFWKQVADHKIDLAIAWHFEKTLLEAYRWLVDNYQDGDCIFLFGFSRGAFQARVLSAMIHKVGLLYKGNEAQIPFAFELYADPKSGEQEIPPVGSTGEEPKISMAQRFKDTFSRKGVRVHFVGAWDTVSSIGVARGKRVLPLAAEGMTHVCYFRHALALDERRVKFLPEYVWGGSFVPPKPGLPSTGVVHNDRARPHTSEVWFPGTHSDIGGGNAINIGLDRSRPPLRWMVSQAAELGLRIDAFKRELKESEQINFQESLKGLWNLFEVLPFQRLTLSRTQLNGTTRKPHLGAGRKIHDGQKIHFSFVEGKTESPYIPKARPPQNRPTLWEDLRNNVLEGSSQLIERDVFYRAADAVKKLVDGEEHAESWEQLIADPTGYQFLYDEVIETLRRWDQNEPKLEASVRHRLLETTINIFKSSSRLKLETWRTVSTVLEDLLKSGDPEQRNVAQNFERHFLKDVNCLLELREHASLVSSVQFLPDGARLVSGSWDRTIRIWDATTGSQVGAPLQGHSDDVNSVAISPDGKRIVSGSDDSTIRIWDAETETGKHVGEPLQGHTYRVVSVAISPDGRHIVSGSYDNTIRIWDAETGRQVGEPLQGHTGCESVAISPDSKRIVSGSDDGTIRIWDAEKGEQVGKPLKGHTGWVKSVAISPDGKQIVSGADDRTIRIWDLEKGVQVGEPLRGHTESVLSVAISLDGKYIVSGSWDHTIRIWDFETRVQVGEPLRGHTNAVCSIAISPDGRRIASGSGDNTIRIWSTEGILY